jgi:dihydroorotase
VPDTFGTDLHQGNLNGPVVDMQTTLGKVLSMGVSVVRMVEGVTVNAARAIRRPELGTLSVGAEADVAVFAVEKGRFGYSDCGHASMTGKYRLSNRVTLVRGRVAFDSGGLSMVPWQKAPPQYFTTPRLQSDPPAMADSDPLPKWNAAP